MSARSGADESSALFLRPLTPQQRHTQTSRSLQMTSPESIGKWNQIHHQAAKQLLRYIREATKLSLPTKSNWIIQEHANADFRGNQTLNDRLDLSGDYASQPVVNV